MDDDPDSWQQAVENERAEYEAWSQWLDEQLNKQEKQDGNERRDQRTC